MIAATRSHLQRVILDFFSTAGIGRINPSMPLLLALEKIPMHYLLKPTFCRRFLKAGKKVRDSANQELLPRN